MRLTENFTKQEFDSKDGALMGTVALHNVKKLAENLQRLRDYLGVPIHINSGYRSFEHNKRIGGRKGSYHLKGMAADITVKNMKPKKVRKAILELIKIGAMSEGGIGLYNGFVHYDTRGIQARWNNSTWF